MHKTITIYHSPDADDAFMFYGLQSGEIGIPGYEFKHELLDIESLNHLALKGELEVTAVSVHAYAWLQDRYLILPCGASMGGEDYGPRLLGKKDFVLGANKSLSVAIPGKLTSAYLAFQLFVRANNFNFEPKFIYFDEIIPAILNNDVDLGLVIHEGQISYTKDELYQFIDLGEWWWKETGLPLPLGINIVRKDLGEEACRAVNRVLRSSIEYALSHREDALKYALSYGRGLSQKDADTFVGMYVNERTLDLGEEGKKSIELFLNEGRKAGLIEGGFKIEFVEE